MKRETIETILWVFMIVVMLTLTLKLNLESGDYECGKCTITLSTIRAGMDEPMGYTDLVIEDLFEEYKQDGCVISWSPTDGFVNGY